MQLHQFTGSFEAATLLRELADGIEKGAICVDGGSMPLSEQATAILELAGVPGGGLSLVGIRLFQHRPDEYRVADLEREIAHPGE